MSDRDDALEEAAAFCEFYANERLTLAGDSVLHDPVLAGRPITAASLQRSKEATIDGCINSAAYHAATQIAAHLRSMKRKKAAPIPKDQGGQ